MATEEGLKYGAGKPRIDLIPPELFLELGKVLEFGATKYGERNWENGFAWGRAYAATLRHLVRWSMGEDNDPETGLSHLAHAGTNISFLLAFQARGVGTDDRSPAFRRASVSQPVLTPPAMLPPPTPLPTFAAALPRAE